MRPFIGEITTALTHYREAGREPRAFLLPLLAQDHPAPLSHFVSYFVPLSERMFDLQQKAEMEDRPSEAKVWTVLVAQIWSGFAGYCNGAADVKEVGQPFDCPSARTNLYMVVLNTTVLAITLSASVCATRASPCCSERVEDPSGL